LSSGEIVLAVKRAYYDARRQRAMTVVTVASKKN